MSTLLLLLASLVVPAPAPSPTTTATATATKPDDVIAEIGPYVLTREMFEAFWAGVPAARKAAYEAQGGKRAFLKDLVDEKLLVVEAERRGYSGRPMLRAAAEIARDGIYYRALYEDEVANKVVTEEAIRRYYDEHQEGYKIEEMVRARHIVATPFKEKRITNEKNDDAASEADAKAKIERLKKELDAGADFAQLARVWSEDTTAAEGGLLPDFPRGKMAKPFEEVAFALAEGKVSEVVRTPYGFHLIRVEKLLPAHVPPLAEIRDQVARAVADERKESFRPRLEQLKDELRKSIPTTLHEERLEPDARPGDTSSKPGATPRPAGSPAP